VIGESPRSEQTLSRVPLTEPTTAPLRPSLDRKPAPAQDGSASASDREADPTRQARPGARSGVTGGTGEGAGRAGRVPPPPEVARGGVNPSYAPCQAKLVGEAGDCHCRVAP